MMLKNSVERWGAVSQAFHWLIVVLIVVGNQVQNVFLASVQQGKLGVSMSRSGRTETAPNGDRFIVLQDGRRYEGQPGSGLDRLDGLGLRHQPRHAAGSRGRCRRA